jgi:hypothetical protein
LRVILVLANDPATSVAFRLRKQVVIPFSICMCPQVGVLSRFSHNTDVAFIAGRPVNRVELVDIAIDLVNRRLPGHAPFRFKVANVRDVFVRTLMMRLVNTSYLMFCHTFPVVLVLSSLTGRTDTFNKSGELVILRA